MRTRIWLQLVAVSIVVRDVVAQTSYAHFTLSWSEVVEGTSTPVNSPNGLLEPGEAARLSVSIDFTPVGTLVPYSPPLLAPVAGFFGTPFSVASTVSQSGSTWSNFSTTTGFSGFLGTILSTGDLIGCSVYQPTPGPGESPIPTDPLLGLWQANWTPPTYEPHWATYRLGYASGPALFVATGIDPSGHTTYDIVGASANMGLPVNIPIAPCPGSLGIAVACGALAARRRRRF